MFTCQQWRYNALLTYIPVPDTRGSEEPAFERFVAHLKRCSNKYCQGVLVWKSQCTVGTFI